MGGWSERVMGQKGFFDVERRLEAISAKGDPLETIKKTVRWEDFRADNEAVTETKPEERKSNAGRKPYDAILKFKIVVLQSLHNLSDEQTEYRPHIVHALLRSGTRGPGAGCHHDLAVSPSVGGGRADRQAVRALRLLTGGRVASCKSTARFSASVKKVPDRGTHLSTRCNRSFS
jgi:hypothetical protein